LNRFNPSANYKRAQTTVVPQSTVPISSATVRRSYAPMPNNSSSNVLLNSNMRKPRSYISSATSIMKT